MPIIVKIEERYSNKVRYEVELGGEFERKSADVRLGAAILKVLADGADLSGANLSGANLSGANLSRANLSRANLSGADLSGANLSGATLSCANLSGANLSGANLSDANLSDAYLSRANLSDANLWHANLSDANLSDARWDAEGVIKTTIPPLFTLGGRWDVMISDRHIKIGCQVHSTDEWEAFDDAAIACMDGANARQFWSQWKGAIIALAKAHQSKVAVPVTEEVTP